MKETLAGLKERIFDLETANGKLTKIREEEENELQLMRALVSQVVHDGETKDKKRKEMEAVVSHLDEMEAIVTQVVEDGKIKDAKIVEMEKRFAETEERQKMEAFKLVEDAMQRLRRWKLCMVAKVVEDAKIEEMEKRFEER